MTNFYELADNDRGKLIFTKDQLLAPLQSGMLPPPFPMADGLEERDYYQGKVSGPTDAQRAYVDARDAGCGRRRRVCRRTGQRRGRRARGPRPRALDPPDRCRHREGANP